MTRHVKTRVAVLHGVNLDALDRRPAKHYGDLTYSQLERQITEYCHALGLEAAFFQTNHEGEFVEELHRASDYADGILMNPGAWTHYAWSIRDALELSGLPCVEVHLSAISEREDFRRISVVRELCVASVEGKGPEGYREALERLMAAW